MIIGNAFFFSKEIHEYRPAKQVDSSEGKIGVCFIEGNSDNDASNQHCQKQKDDIQ